MTNTKKFFVAAVPMLLLLVLTAGMRLVQTITPPDDPEPPLPRLRGISPPPSQPRVKNVDAKLQATLQKVVVGQIQAMRSGDYKAALTFSVPGFRARLTPDRFRTMIETQYAPLATWRREKCHTAIMSGKTASIMVQVADASGAENAYLYSLAQVNDQWLVAGCSEAFTTEKFPVRFPVLPGLPYGRMPRLKESVSPDEQGRNDVSTLVPARSSAGDGQ